ncbi:hypothetical protein KI387_017299, partial [Taxus chinensis]
FDGFIFDTICKWRKKVAGFRSYPLSAPKIVVAFSGTVSKPDSFGKDMILDFILLTNELHSSSCFYVVFEAVKTNIHRHRCENVWIIDHSLGATLDLLAGQKMVEEYHHYL